MKSEELSQQLRLGSGHYLSQRRGTVALTMLASASMGLITLYQIRAIASN